jgi:predicted esterase
MKYICYFLFVLFPACLWAQPKLTQLPLPNSLSLALQKLKADAKVNADSASKILARLQTYPDIKDKNRNYLFYYNDAHIGKIPLRVYIPATYSQTKPNACVMVLHGAVSISNFKDIDTLGNTDEDILVDPLKTQGYIIIQPIADKTGGFTWGGRSKAYGEPYRWNSTYQILAQIVVALKRVLNIDDNKVFAFGHSDGADGAIGLGVYEPGQFAGVVAYNSMFKNLSTPDYYIRNIQNRTLYAPTSDLDKLRPVKYTRQIIDSLKKFGYPVLYKEYAGYQHYDKHLSIDEPFADEFMKKQVRNPYQVNIYWEVMPNSPYTTCDWLTIAQADTAMQAAAWHTPFDFKTRFFWERDKTWHEINYYNPLKSAAVKASYNNNVFTLQTSGVTEIELKLSPQMADLKRPVTVIANGKQVFKGVVKADKNYLLNNFEQTADRAALWVNSIKVKID